LTRIFSKRKYAISKLLLYFKFFIGKIKLLIKMKIGVLALQGNFKEHIEMLKKCSVETKEIRMPSDLDDCDGLIIPGGESTTIGKLLKKYKLDKKIIENNSNGMPIFGTCAGAILLATEITDSKQPKLSLIDISVKRNAYGRQVDSFETDVEVNGIGKVKGVFIRAPIISKIYDGVEVLSEFNGEAVLVKNCNILVSTFHPELTDDVKIHNLFIEMVKQNI